MSIHCALLVREIKHEESRGEWPARVAADAEAGLLRMSCARMEAEVAEAASTVGVLKKKLAAEAVALTGLRDEARALGGQCEELGAEV